ncbi:hypothetical protein GGS20DRAFT_560757 [Poronia punctata]|nr:hypothetical protein GGS20DRAFT_560757 [Poronia punctata]
MASGPPTLTRKGSGSRPPTSRFMEGSMNDRTSSAPPPHFMGPEQLAQYENQFYRDQQQQQHSDVRLDRPLSTPVMPRQNSDSQTIRHKKSSSFFGRVRNVLFNRGGGHQQQQQREPSPAKQQHEVRRKHSSLQEPIQQQNPRPDYLQAAGRTQSEVNIAQMLLPTNPRGGAGAGAGADRPSREDIMASYNELVASGFFQSHAIQSTRHVAPGTAAAREPPASLPVIQGSPRPPVRVSSINALTASASAAAASSPMPSPRISRDFTITSPTRPTLSYMPSAPDLHHNNSPRSSRKRGRDEITSAALTPEPTSSSSYSSSSSSSAGYFAQPLKRVAKKLRKMPSLSTSATTTITTTPSIEAASADVILRLPPSISSGGTIYPEERSIRLRSPSPANPETTTAQYRERDYYPEVARRPRRTFSYTLKEKSSSSSRGGHSKINRSDIPRVVHNHGPTTQTETPLGQWQRISLEDPIVYRHSAESVRPQQQQQQNYITTSPSTNTNTSRPLQILPDANRGIPAVPKVPERWHGTGKAYHLKDRGSRPDLREKENDDDDDDGDDVDMLIVNRRRGRTREREQNQHQQQQQHNYWRIGNAL